MRRFFGMGSRHWSAGMLGTSVASLALMVGAAPFAGSVVAQDSEKASFVFVANDDDDDDDDDGEVAKATAPKVWLGVMLKEIEGDLASYLGDKKGILVTSVYEGSPADEAGIEEGDILVKAKGQKLTSPASLLKVMRSLDDDTDEVMLLLLRNGEETRLAVTPAERPDIDTLVIGDDEEMRFNIQGVGEAEGAVRNALKMLRTGNDGKEMNIFRFGGPSMVFDTDGHELSGDIEVVIVKEVDGEELEVKVKRKDDQPAVVTVIEGDEETTYEVDDLDSLPEPVQVIVKPILGEEGKLRLGRRLQIVSPNFGEFKGQFDSEAIAKMAREMAEKHSAELSARAAKAREMAESYQVKAEEQAAQARKSVERMRARLKSDASSELTELRALVDELRQEVQELRAKLKKESDD